MKCPDCDRPLPPGVHECSCRAATPPSEEPADDKAAWVFSPDSQPVDDTPTIMSPAEATAALERMSAKEPAFAPAPLEVTDELDDDVTSSTLNVLLKYQTDIERAAKELSLDIESTVA